MKLCSVLLLLLVACLAVGGASGYRHAEDPCAPVNQATGELLAAQPTNLCMTSWQQAKLLLRKARVSEGAACQCLYNALVTRPDGSQAKFTACRQSASSWTLDCVALGKQRGVKVAPLEQRNAPVASSSSSSSVAKRSPVTSTLTDTTVSALDNFVRPGASSGSFDYEDALVYVDACGTYDLTVDQATLGVLVYKAPFDDSRPNVNLIAGFGSPVSISLLANTNYVVVVTSIDAGVQAPYTVTIVGPGTVQAGPAPALTSVSSTVSDDASYGRVFLASGSGCSAIELRQCGACGNPSLSVNAGLVVDGSVTTSGALKASSVSAAEALITGDLGVTGDISLTGTINRALYEQGGHVWNPTVGDNTDPANGQVLFRQGNDGSQYCSWSAWSNECAPPADRTVTELEAGATGSLNAEGGGLAKRAWSNAVLDDTNVIVGWVERQAFVPSTTAKKRQDGGIQENRDGYFVQWDVAANSRVGNTVQVNAGLEEVGALRDMRVVAIDSTRFAVFFSLLSIEEGEEVSYGLVSIYTATAGASPSCGSTCNLIWFAADAERAKRAWEPQNFNAVFNKLAGPGILEFQVVHNAVRNVLNVPQGGASSVPAGTRDIKTVHRSFLARKAARRNNPALARLRSLQQQQREARGTRVAGAKRAIGTGSAAMTSVTIHVYTSGSAAKVVMVDQAQTPTTISPSFYDLGSVPSGGPSAGAARQVEASAQGGLAFRDIGAPLGLLKLGPRRRSDFFVVSVWNGVASQLHGGLLSSPDTLRQSGATAYGLIPEGRGDLFTFWSNPLRTEFAEEQLELCWWFDADPSLYSSSLVKTNGDGNFLSRIGCWSEEDQQTWVWQIRWNLGDTGHLSMVGQPRPLYTWGPGPAVNRRAAAASWKTSSRAQRQAWSGSPDVHGPLEGSDAQSMWYDSARDKVYLFDSALRGLHAFTPGQDDWRSIDSSTSGYFYSATVNGWTQPPTSFQGFSVGCNAVLVYETSTDESSSSATIELLARQGVSAGDTCQLPSPQPAPLEAACVWIAPGRCLAPGGTATVFTGQPLGKTWYTAAGTPTADFRDAAYSLDCTSTTTCTFDNNVPYTLGPVNEDTTSEVDALFGLLNVVFAFLGA